MDIYGYPAYQYNQSDELAKQMFAQQALSTTMPYNNPRGMPEPHYMPAPTGAPWNPQGLAWGMQSPPQLVQFTATPESKLTPVIHCKRKSLDVEPPPIPSKQLITEEKMAAHLNSLHISSEYTSHSLASQESMDLTMEQPSASPDICEKFKGHTIVLSEEVKKLKDEPLLPPSLIERLEKPRMSLVVWKPKDNILEKLKEEKEEEIKEETTPRRNGVLVPDMNRMDVEM